MENTLNRRQISGLLRKGGFKAMKSETTAIRGYTIDSDGYFYRDNDKTKIVLMYSTRKNDAPFLESMAGWLESNGVKCKVDSYELHIL